MALCITALSCTHNATSAHSERWERVRRGEPRERNHGSPSRLRVQGMLSALSSERHDWPTKWPIMESKDPKMCESWPAQKRNSLGGKSTRRMGAGLSFVFPVLTRIAAAPSFSRFWKGWETQLSNLLSF